VCARASDREPKRFFLEPQAVGCDREHIIAGLHKAGVPEWRDRFVTIAAAAIVA